YFLKLQLAEAITLLDLWIVQRGIEHEDARRQQNDILRVLQLIWLALEVADGEYIADACNLLSLCWQNEKFKELPQRILKGEFVEEQVLGDCCCQLRLLVSH